MHIWIYVYSQLQIYIFVWMQYIGWCIENILAICGTIYNQYTQQYSGSV
jgi:hypothetical protein